MVNGFADLLGFVSFPNKRKRRKTVTLVFRESRDDRGHGWWMKRKAWRVREIPDCVSTWPINLVDRKRHETVLRNDPLIQPQMDWNDSLTLAWYSSDCVLCPFGITSSPSYLSVTSKTLRSTLPYTASCILGTTGNIHGSLFGNARKFGRQTLSDVYSHVR